MYNRVVCCWAFIIASLCWNIQSTDALQCYSCNNAKSVSECTEITDCDSADARCRFEFISTVNGKIFNLGCSGPDAKDCPEINPDRLGASRANDNCSSCCDTNNCNRQLCQPHAAASVCLCPDTLLGCQCVGIQGVKQDSYCHDEASFDCATIGATINYCEELSRARTYCKNFCGLCSLRDGHWSSWSAWSDCSVSCGNGTQNRSRACSSPAPWNGGDDCVGTDLEVKTCSMKPCPVHGEWTSWGAWGSCSVTCDLGLQRRDRYCRNPYPSADGRHCNGDTRDDKICVMPGCTNGSWSAWASWGACSRTCGDGIQSRSRTCDSPVPSISGRSCVGDPVQTQSCKVRNCRDGGWSAWASWGSCSRTCGDGIRSRSRTCDNPIPSISGRNCAGVFGQTQSCRVRNCRVKVSAFTVQGPTGNGAPLTFSTTVFNEGSNFNAGTGKFTCSVPGVYFFALSLIKKRSSDDNVNDGVGSFIRQNRHNTVHAYIDPNDVYADFGSYGVSATVTLRLQTGDVVDAWSWSWSSRHMESNSMFSGFLIQPDEP